MIAHKPLKTYEDIYLKILELLFKEEKSLISQPLQSLLVQKISTPLYTYLQLYSTDIYKKISLPTIFDLLRENDFLVFEHKIKFSPKKFLKHFSKGIAILIFSALYLLVMPKPKSIPRYNLVYGLSSSMIYGPSREIRCHNFFNIINPKVHNSKSVTLINFFNFNLSLKKRKENYKVVLYIPLYLLRAQGISKIQLIKSLLTGFKLWRSIYAKLPCSIILGPELMLDSNTLINLNEINSISTTVSQWGIQPYFFHKLNGIPKNFFWYSNNSEPLVTNGYGSYNTGLSYLRYIKANHHFVWTDRFGKLIREFIDVDYTILESILFYLPSGQNTRKVYDILIFDVPPAKAYELTSYYSNINSTKFISDILEVANILGGLKDSISLALKPKRKYSKFHAKEYVEMIRTLSSLGRFELIDPDYNIFELIKSAKFVVVIPFSSPALIAQRLGVKTCYYNPDSRFSFEKIVDGVRVINSVEEFINFYHEP